MAKRKEASRRKHHILYRTTCLITGKYYVGIHSTDDINDGYLGSGTKLRWSVKKHGPKNHIREILETLPTRVELFQRESEVVGRKLLRDPLCMNIVHGGWSPIEHSKETRMKMSKLNVGRVWCYKPGTRGFKKVWPDKVPEGYILGFNKPSRKTRKKMSAAQHAVKDSKIKNSKGKAWYFNPEAGKHGRFRPDEVIPTGFIKGDYRHKSEEELQTRRRAMKAYANTPKAKRIIRERFMGRKWYHDPSSGSECLLAPGSNIPSGHIPGRKRFSNDARKRMSNAQLKRQWALRQKGN